MQLNWITFPDLDKPVVKPKDANDLGTTHPVKGQSGKITLLCAVTTSDTGLTYEWTDGDGLIIGTDSEELELEPVKATTGAYTCKVSSDWFTSSDNAKYTDFEKTSESLQVTVLCKFSFRQNLEKKIPGSFI